MKRCLHFTCFLLLLALPALAVCQEPPEPSAILKKAIAAHGGEANLSKPRKGILKGKGSIRDSEGVQEETFDLPNRWKKVTTMLIDGQVKVQHDLMVDGKLWEWTDGEEPREAMNQLRAGPHFSHVTALLELKSDQQFKLSPLDRTTIRDRAAVGFRATGKDWITNYYFDEKTGLLVQTGFFLEVAGKEFDVKLLVEDYKEVDGVKIPHRRSLYLKGSEVEEYVEIGDFTVTEIRILDRLPKDAFALPNARRE